MVPKSIRPRIPAERLSGSGVEVFKIDMPRHEAWTRVHDFADEEAEFRPAELPVDEARFVLAIASLWWSAKDKTAQSGSGEELESGAQGGDDIIGVNPANKGKRHV